MSAPTFARPPVEAGSPEWRAALLGQAIAYSAHLTGPISPYALGTHLHAFCGQEEEQCGGEVFDAIVAMIRLGLFISNTMDLEAGTITFGGETRLTATPMLIRFVYGEPERGSEDEP